MKRLIFSAVLGCAAILGVAHAQQAQWLWWGTNQNTSVPVSAANPLPVTGLSSSGMKTDGSNATGAALNNILSAGSYSLGGAVTWLSGLGAISQLTGPNDQPFQISSTAPTQISASAPGTGLNLFSSDATAGSGTNGAAAGGGIFISAGNAKRLNTGNANGGAIQIETGAGIGLSGVAGIFTLGTPSGTALTMAANLGLTCTTATNQGAGTFNCPALYQNGTALTALATTTPGTGVAAALGTNVGTAGAFVVNGGVLGTPSSGTLTNATGLPIAGITGLGTGVATALENPTGTGSGDLVLGGTITAGGPTGSATVAPIITYNAAGQLTTVSSATITPAVGSVTGLGTGVATALGDNVGSAGAFVTFNGAGGTPSSLTLTNATGLPTAGILNSAVTYAKIQNETNATLLGNNSGGSAAPEEISLGTGLSFSGTTLNAATVATDTVGTGVTAAGTSQGAATALTHTFNEVTTVGSPSAGTYLGVQCPTPSAGAYCKVVNKGANPLNVYPTSGVTIDTLASNAPILVAVNTQLYIEWTTTTQGYSK